MLLYIPQRKKKKLSYDNLYLIQFKFTHELSTRSIKLLHTIKFVLIPFVLHRITIFTFIVFLCNSNLGGSQVFISLKCLFFRASISTKSLDFVLKNLKHKFCNYITQFRCSFFKVLMYFKYCKFLCMYIYMCLYMLARLCAYT